tara:strand:+ start:153 stop:449 length:297 start_codon:yes stop_codon:yes gene_type:complete
MDFYLDSLKVSDLKEICKNSGIIGISKLNKQKLIEVMMGCDLKDSGYEPAVIELEKIVPPPLIILHLPIKPDSLKVPVKKWEEMFKKGKKILEKDYKK